MPFINGQWITPTLEDIEQTKELISSEFKENIISPPQELMDILHNLENNNFDSLYKLLQTTSVDIIIPCHNGLDHLKRCLTNLEKYTYINTNVIIVNDASNKLTSEYINSLEGYTIINNPTNLGFAATCNIGMLAGKAPFVVLLNTDVLVTPGWLVKMLIAAYSASNIGMVNPVTNNTAITNREMEPGFSYYDMNKAAEILFKPVYPEIMPTGFCLMIKREILDNIGLFDESYVSYGEESDLWQRMLKGTNKDGLWMNYKAVLADNCYVFHERGGSFSAIGELEWNIKRKTGSNKFHSTHPEFSIFWNPMPYETKNVLSKIRRSFPKELSFTPDKINVAFLTYSLFPNGGMKFISDIVNHLIEDGNYNVKVIHVARETKDKLGSESLGCLHTAPIPFEFGDDFNQIFSKGIIIGATAELGPTLVNIAKDNPNLIPIIFAQSYDPDIAPDLKKEFEEIYSTVGKVITNNPIIDQKILMADPEITTDVVEPYIDDDVFTYRERYNSDLRPTILISLDKTYPFRNYKGGLEIAKYLHEKYSNKIRILAVGVDKLNDLPYINCKGVLAQSAFAKLLGNEVDIFIDPSNIHSYGLPALEAYYSGCIAISLLTDGSEHVSYSLHEDERFVVELSMEWLLKNIDQHIQKCPILDRYKNKDFTDFRKGAVEHFKNSLHYMAIKPPSKSKPTITFVTPHLRKQGGPTTILTTANGIAARGYDTKIVSIYKDSINQDLIRSSRVPVFFGINNLRETDIVFVPSDSDKHEEITKKHIPFKILLKLSHNPRFKKLEEEGLNADYDRILTSTEWLAEACLNPLEGWKHDSDIATVVGWYNHGFNDFNCHFSKRQYNKLNDSTVVIGGLVHQHPLKGTKDLITIFKELKRKYKSRVTFIGIGEQPMKDIPEWFQYVPNLNRRQMAGLFKEIDIWVGCSYSEGLGRLGLEAMSSSIPCVLSNTGAEYILPGKNALEFNIGDTRQAINHIDELLNDTELFKNLAANGYETAKHYADPTYYIDNIEKVIQELWSVYGRNRDTNV